MATIIVDGKPMELQDTKFFNLICHQQGITVGIPGAIEISPENTTKTCRDLSDKDWDTIRTDPVFLKYFVIMFKNDKELATRQLPVSKEALLSADMGIQHICGMIIMLISNAPVYVKRSNIKIFFKYPETYLHPSSITELPDMILAVMRDLYGHKS